MDTGFDPRTDQTGGRRLSRRDFLKLMAAAGGVLSLDPLFRALERGPVTDPASPLAYLDTVPFDTSLSADTIDPRVQEVLDSPDYRQALYEFGGNYDADTLHPDLQRELVRANVRAIGETKNGPPASYLMYEQMLESPGQESVELVMPLMIDHLRTLAAEIGIPITNTQIELCKVPRT